MAYNRKMRKFEGTCYIPGEQLAMMAKYYRGANLNLNLTLFEDDLATMQETLDQACWCSKLDELDRMKMSHMKGNEWRIQHDHCLEEAQQGPGGRNPKVYPALPHISKSTVGKVERGTSAVSLYDRERGMVRGDRYQRDDYYNPRNRSDEFNDLRNRRGYYSDPRDVREDYDMRYRRDDYPGPPAFHAQVLQIEKRTGRNMGGPPDRKDEMKSEAAMSSLAEIPGDVRCAVCNVETCLVCKNHLYSTICQCKCPVANAGLCNKCSQEPCEEEELVVQETGGNKMDLSSMMLTMMMSSMFKQCQAPETTVCCCKPSRDNSESSSSDSSDGKVHKVYLYDCENPKRNKKSKKKFRKASSDSSSACECCKCSQKQKKNLGKKEKGSKRSGKETSDSHEGHNRQSTKGKGREDSNRKSKGGDGNLDIDMNPKGSEESNRKQSGETRRSNKSSKEDDAKSVKSENMKFLKMKDRNWTSVRASEVKTQGSKAQGSIDSKNVQFSNNNKKSPRKSQESSSSESDVPKRSRKSPQTVKPEIQMCELLDTQHSVPDLESSYHTKKDGDIDGVGEESSTTFNLKEFIVCLPKIQSNLQSLMYKLNHMDRLNNQLQYPQIDPSTMANAQLSLREMRTHQDVPLISSPQNPLSNAAGSLCDEHPQLYNQFQRYDPEISIGQSPGNLPDQNLPLAISPGSSKDEPKMLKPFDPAARYHSIVNFPNFGERPESIRTTAGELKQVPQVTELAGSTKQPETTVKFLPLVEEAQAKGIIGKSGNQWPFKKGNHTIHSPSLISSNADQNLPQPYLESEQTTIKMHCKKQPGDILHCKKGDRVNEEDIQPLLNAFSPSGFNNVEIIELPESESRHLGKNHSRKSTYKGHGAGTAAATSSRYEGETIFQSYNRESSAETSHQDLTDYASFTDEKYFQLSPAPSVPQATYQRTNQREDEINLDTSSGEAELSQKCDQQHRSILSKCSRNKCELRTRTLGRTRSTLKAPKGLTFKAKKRNPLSLEKLVQGCTLRGSEVTQGSRKSNVAIQEKAGSSRNPKMKLLDQGVGPGKFRQSKSDSSLDLLNGNTCKSNLAASIRPETPKSLNEWNKELSVTPTSAGKHHEVIPLQKKRTVSPTKETAKYTMATKKSNILPKREEPLVLGKCGFKTMLSDPSKDQSDSILKMPDAYVRQEIDSKSYFVSSVEVKTINDHGSSTDILKMLQGIASNSVMNMTSISSVPQETAPVSSDDFDIVPLLPLSSKTPADCPESTSNNQYRIVQQVSFDNEVSSNTPAFLRKSRVQVEQLKRAHETIRSMIRNVNEVIAHIDSDSKIGIKSKARSEDKEMQSYFVHPDDDDDEKSHCKPQDSRNDQNHSEKQAKPSGTTTKPAYSGDKQNREVQEMFLSVNRVINSVLTPSDQSNVTQEAQWPSENTTPNRAHRDFFILNSESSSTAFTESLRRSLENDASRSVPLATQQVHAPQCVTSQRPRSTRPLKRRSWFPHPKK